MPRRFRLAVLVHKLWNTLNFVVGGLATLLVLQQAGKEVLQGTLSPGDAVSFGVYGVGVGHAASDAAHAAQYAAACLARAAVALDLLDQEEAKAAEADAAEERSCSVLAMARLPVGCLLYTSPSPRDS